MNTYYSMTSGYASKLDPEKMFKDRKDAVRYDQEVASVRLSNLEVSKLDTAMRGDLDSATVERFQRLSDAASLFVSMFEDNCVRIEEGKRRNKPEPPIAGATEPVDVETLPMPPRMVGADRGESGELTF